MSQRLPVPPLDPVKVRARRFDLALEQNEAARRAGISKQMWNDIEMGRKTGSFTTHKAIARVLRASVKALRPDEGENAA